MPKLTEHFSLEEMTFSETAVRHGLDNRPNSRSIQNLTELCEELLEPIRELAGGPINVTSGYRSPSVNSVDGGSLNFQHMSGEARISTVHHSIPGRYLRESVIPVLSLIN
jgi:uncharacterized protein YcbK (DUF882 family)